MPILREGELDIISYSAEQTERLGIRLGKLLQAGDVICLSGEMGAGKTVFSSGIGHGWGATHPLKSPTYNLVHQHRREKDAAILHHLDCYRLSGVLDIESIGFDEMVDSDSILVIEWADRIESVLPSERLWIQLRVTEVTRRNFVLDAKGERYQDLVRRFRESAFGG